MGATSGSQEYEWGSPVVSAMSLRPSEYWARQCHVGASFMRPAEAPLRSVVGVDHVMWGSDYPHREGSYPFSRQALRAAFATASPDELRQVLAVNAARVYGLDLAFLDGVAASVGPTHAEIAVPLEAAEVPDDAFRCPAFAGFEPQP
jgi:hypothetical protein